MESTHETIARLQERLQRFPPERSPIQHATIAFRLGTELADTDRLSEARQYLERAAGLFGDRFPREHARCLNSLGSVLRSLERVEEAVATFSAAARRFAEANELTDEGAARFNLGLCLRQLGDHEGSLVQMELASPLLADSAGETVVARERAAGLLLAGRPETAMEVLASVEASAGGKPREEGAVANLIGLAKLALEDGVGAVAAFRRSAASNPVRLRPHAHAMAKANLALAHEGLGEDRLARLAASQALALDQADGAVGRLARSILGRLGNPSGDLAPVLANQTGDPSAARDELVRWLGLKPVGRREQLGAFLLAALAADDTIRVMEGWLEGLMELPGDELRTVTRSAIEALAEMSLEEIDRVRASVNRALARFHPPQWRRVAVLLDEEAEALGIGGGWG